MDRSEADAARRRLEEVHGGDVYDAIDSHGSCMAPKRCPLCSNRWLPDDGLCVDCHFVMRLRSKWWIRILRWLIK